VQQPSDYLFSARVRAAVLMKEPALWWLGWGWNCVPCFKWSYVISMGRWKYSL